jgi:site-specific recombinase XerD
MAVFKKGKWYQYEFVLNGKRIQESAKTTSKTVAIEAERIRRRELEQAALGIPVAQRADRIKSVADAVKQYLETYSVNHRVASVLFSTNRLAHVKRLLGAMMLSDLSEHAIRHYMKTRLAEEVTGRTINAELGELSRAIGKSWSVLWPKVRKMEERKDVGKALSSEEQDTLFDALLKARSPILSTFVRTSLLTAMRSGEILNLSWGQVDLNKRVITVGKAKTSSGTGRQIPINQELFSILAAHAGWFTKRFGGATNDQFLFPYGKPTPSDPTRPTTTIKTAWNRLRREAGIKCRLHDLRHTALTNLAEAGTPEGTMLALAGHMSRAMIERYSHIRMGAKREAMEALSSTKYSGAVPVKSPVMAESTKVN